MEKSTGGDNTTSNASLMMQEEQQHHQPHPSSFSTMPISSGMRAIQRNRRGPMIRRSRKKYPHHSLTTHSDHDDREILIESALGSYNDGRYDGRYDGDYNSNLDRLSGGRRRNYAPLREYDILSDEERKAFSFPSPESIFKLPKSWRWPPTEGQHEPKQLNKNCGKLFHRLIMLLLGMGVYLLVFLITKKYNHTVGSTATLTSSPKEIDVDIKQMTTENVFEYNYNNTKSNDDNRNDNINNGHVNNLIMKIKKDETLDIGYTVDDDMNLNFSISGVKNREKETTSAVNGEGKDHPANS